jgi:uncharacterized membrane-anchored protein
METLMGIDFQHADFNTLATIFLFAGLPALAAFVILYATRSPWRSTEPGRAVMYLASSLMVVYILAAVNAIFGQDWPYRGVLRFLIYAVVSSTFYRLLFTLIRIQNGRNIPPTQPPGNIRSMAQEDKEGPS